MLSQLEQKIKVYVEPSPSLRNDKPLIFDEITSECFANPDRKKFPGFINNKDYPLCQINENPEYFLKLIKPTLVEKFNRESITLHNTDFLWDQTTTKEKVDKSAYISQLKKSRWYGPYKYANSDLFTSLQSSNQEKLSILAYQF